MAPSSIEANTTTVEVPPDLDERFIALKQKLVAPENREKVTESWKRILRQIDAELSKIEEAGSSYVPQVDWNDIVANNYELPSEISRDFKTKGVLMVNKLIDEKQIDKWFDEMVQFCKDHPESSGFNFFNPASWYNLFWTKPQCEARAHPNVQQIMKIMAHQFYVSDPNCLLDLDTQVVYGDRIRIRQPGTSAALPLHLDSSSIERWEDEAYRAVYKEIFEGNWEDWDPFNLDARAYANENLYHDMTDGVLETCCSSFRTLQGWLALSNNKTGEGTLKVLPNIKLTMAYIMLRPLFWRDPPSGDIDDYEMDLKTSKFPGTKPTTGQLYIPDKFFHHLHQDKSCIGIPDVKKGTYVFWHCDLPHEVDREHNGDGHSSVFYYGQAPLSLENIKTLLDTKNSFTNNVSPDDYRSGLTEEEKALDFQGADIKNVPNFEGLQSMGFEPFNVNDSSLTVGQRNIRVLANKAIESNSADFVKSLQKIH